MVKEKVGKLTYEQRKSEEPIAKQQRRVYHRVHSSRIGSKSQHTAKRKNKKRILMLTSAVLSALFVRRKERFNKNERLNVRCVTLALGEWKRLVQEAVRFQTERGRERGKLATLFHKGTMVENRKMIFLAVAHALATLVIWQHFFYVKYRVERGGGAGRGVYIGGND